MPSSMLNEMMGVFDPGQSEPHKMLAYDRAATVAKIRIFPFCELWARAVPTDELIVGSWLIAEGQPHMIIRPTLARASQRASLLHKLQHIITGEFATIPKVCILFRPGWVSKSSFAYEVGSKLFDALLADLWSASRHVHTVGTEAGSKRSCANRWATYALDVFRSTAPEGAPIRRIHLRLSW